MTPSDNPAAVPPPPRHRERVGLAATFAVAGTVGLSAAMTLGVVGFSAGVSGNGTFTSGTLILSKANGAGTCLSSPDTAGGIQTNINASCSGDDLNGGTTNGIGVPSSADVTSTNQGSVASSTGLQLAGGTCSTASAPYGSSPDDNLASGSDSAGFCGQVWVTVGNETGTGSCLYPAAGGACPAPSSSDTLATLAPATVPLVSSLASGASEVVKFTTEIGTSATNADQGLVASLALTYSLAQ